MGGFFFSFEGCIAISGAEQHASMVLQEKLSSIVLSERAEGTGIEQARATQIKCSCKIICIRASIDTLIIQWLFGS